MSKKLTARMRQGRKQAFLLRFRQMRSVALAAARVGVNRMTVYKWMRADAQFKAAYQDTVEALVDQVERELLEMTDGTHKRMVVSGGKVLGEEPVHDVRAMEVFLRAHRAAYRPEPMSVAVNTAVGVSQKVVLTPKEEARLVAQAAQYLVEAGVMFGGAHPENEHELTAIEDFKSRRVMKLLDPTPPPEQDA
jgi:AcrR family transcriptional regulator